MKFTSHLGEMLNKEKDHFWLWVPILLGFGAAFYINFEIQFLNNFLTFFFLFFAAVFLANFNRTSFRCLIYLACAIFLFGSFYVNFYQKIFLNHTPITGKIYVDGVGKVESIKKFYNPVNHLAGATLVISNPTLYKSEYVAKKVIKKIKVKKIYKKKPSIIHEKKVRKTQKQKAEELGLSLVEYKEIRLLEKEKKAAKKIQKQQEKEFKKQQKLREKIQKNYANVLGYQDLDRNFSTISKNYQQVQWQQDAQGSKYPHPPKKILINLVKYQNNISLNDVVAVRMMLQPPDDKEFSNGFDLKINSKATKVGAYGFGFGEVKILKKAEISSIDSYFIDLRKNIKERIIAVIDGDLGGIALALLIGDQKEISDGLMNDIRSSGLAHLLSISGFHLSLMATIFLFSTRFLLSRNEYLTLNFDLKKIAAISALIATYFYLKIADSPLPAQRSFLMVAFVLLAIFLSEKINAKRVVMSSAFLMILANPFSVLNIGFQLSFAAIIVLGAFYEWFSKHVDLSEKHSFLSKCFWYFAVIILTSIAIQIATIPLLMHSFQNVSILGFIANILAIPLASFYVMPLGFLALFLMVFGLEKYVLILMKYGIILIAKIATFVTNLDYSHFISPQISSLGLVLAIIGILLICLSKSEFRYLGIALFLSAFATLYLVKKPDISFVSNQRFFTLYDKENGLVFSKKLNPSKQRQLWMKQFNQNEFKSLENFSSDELLKRGIFCDKLKCEIVREKKILILLQRNKLLEICKNNFDVIVNLTAKYSLPDCISKDKIKIDNLDFYQKGGQFFYFKEDELVIETSVN